MRFDVLTLFPEMLEAVLGGSIIGRAQKDDLIDLNFVQIRSYSNDKHRRVDDYPYGGGTGMLMAAQPIYDAYRSVTDGLGYKPHTVYMSPKGSVFNQNTAKRLLEKKHIVILCGHYEGVDQRVLDEIIDEEISVGDYVLTGGELPACIVIDCVARLLDGVLADKICHEEESLSSGLLEYPQYTRPAEFLGRKVPEVLLSGNHAAVDAWRYEKAFAKTMLYRPDILDKKRTLPDK